MTLRAWELEEDGIGIEDEFEDVIWSRRSLKSHMHIFLPLTWRRQMKENPRKRLKSLSCIKQG